MRRFFDFSSRERSFLKGLLESHKQELEQLISDYYFEDDSQLCRTVRLIDKMLLKLEGVTWPYGEEYTSSN